MKRELWLCVYLKQRKFLYETAMFAETQTQTTKLAKPYDNYKKNNLDI